MINFVKVLKYIQSMPGVDDFDYSADLGLQKIDPHTMRPGGLVLEAPIVFHSTLNRVVECIAYRDDILYIPTDVIREIPFDLYAMCSREEYNRQKSTAVRSSFMESFILDKLPVKREKIINEAKQILRSCYEVSEDCDVAVVSHSFRLKVIEAFIMTEGRLKADPSLIRGYIREDKKTFEFGGGFEIERDRLHAIAV